MNNPSDLPNSKSLPPGRYGNLLVLPPTGPGNATDEELTWPIVEAQPSASIQFFQGLPEVGNPSDEELSWPIAETKFISSDINPLSKTTGEISRKSEINSTSPTQYSTIDRSRRFLLGSVAVFISSVSGVTKETVDDLSTIPSPYRIEYSSVVVDQQLGSIWLSLSSEKKTMFVEALTAIEEKLARAPHAFGESRNSNQRLACFGDLVIMFEIDEADKRVLIFSITQCADIS